MHGDLSDISERSNAKNSDSQESEGRGFSKSPYVFSNTLSLSEGNEPRPPKPPTHIANLIRNVCVWPLRLRVTHIDLDLDVFMLSTVVNLFLN